MTAEVGDDVGVSDPVEEALGELAGEPCLLGVERMVAQQDRPIFGGGLEHVEQPCRLVRVDGPVGLALSGRVKGDEPVAADLGHVVVAAVSVLAEPAPVELGLVVVVSQHGNDRDARHLALDERAEELVVLGRALVDEVAREDERVGTLTRGAAQAKFQVGGWRDGHVVGGFEHRPAVVAAHMKVGQVRDLETRRTCPFSLYAPSRTCQPVMARPTPLRTAHFRNCRVDTLEAARNTAFRWVSAICHVRRRLSGILAMGRRYVRV